MNKRKTLFATALLTGGFLIGRSILRSVRATKLDGKVAIVTGGSRGLGFILAGKLLEKGARVVICARNKDELKDAADKLSEYKGQLLTFTCDVSDRRAVSKMARKVKDELGTVDILINNAGIIQVGPADKMTREDYERAMEVHYWGPLNMIEETLPVMLEKGSGNIVNIASIGAKVSFPHLLPYNGSKFALSGLSEGLTAELSKTNVRVTTVYPGLMRTGSPVNIDVKGQFKKELSWFKIADSLPGMSISAEKAAQRIIKAMQNGDRTLVLSLAAKLAVAMHGVAPGMDIAAFSLIKKALPESVGEGTGSRKGYQSETKLSRSLLTKLTNKAEVKYNQKAE